MIYFIITIISILIGYCLGRFNKPEQVVSHFVNGVSKLVHEQTTSTIPTGAIKPKTAKDILEKQLPKKVIEGREAMRETLDASPELKTHRLLVEKARKENAERGIYE